MTKQKQSGIVCVQPSELHWIIPGVKYRGETGTYAIFKQMTPSMTQDKLAELYEKTKPKELPHPTDASLIIAIACRAYNLRNEKPKEAETFRDSFRTGLRRYPHTLTRGLYIPSEEDHAIHNYNTSDQYSLDGKIVGPSNWIKDIPDKQVLNLLFETSSVSLINKMSQWINKTNSYLWRLNSKPTQKEERVVRFYAYSDRLSLYCDGYPLNEFPAFRVLRIE